MLSIWTGLKFCLSVKRQKTFLSPFLAYLLHNCIYVFLFTFEPSEVFRYSVNCLAAVSLLSLSVSLCSLLTNFDNLDSSPKGLPLSECAETQRYKRYNMFNPFITKYSLFNPLITKYNMFNP